MEINYDEELEFIAEATGLDIETIESVLEADLDFLESKGLMVRDEE